MSTEHPDEGTIHAWLDGALGDVESSRVAAHVASCAACASAVAEARGLIAGASRVVRALDDASATSTAPTWGAAARAALPGESSAWRALRVTPARAAIAATLLVVAGITLTHDWTAQESALVPAPRAVVAAPSPGPARDPLLDSAISRNVAQAVPPRTLERAPGPDIPSAPPSATSPLAVDATARNRVADGRTATRAQRDSSPVQADQLATRIALAPAAAPTGNIAARKSVPAAGELSVRMDAPLGSPSANLALAGQCLRIESTTPGATWGALPLPLDVVLQPGHPDHGPVRIAGQTNGPASPRWTRTGGDSVRLDLRRPGYSATIELAANGDVRSGVMRSGAVQSQLGEVVVTGTGDTADSTPSPSRQRSAVMRKRAAASQADAAGALASVPSSDGAAIPVRARPVSCP